MKYFFVHLTQHDGEHEHTTHHLAKGQSEKSVRNRIEREQLYDAFEDGHKNSVLSYFDGTTAVSKYWLKEIPKEHFELMHQNNYVYEV
jgi:hypothetical protein